jgi:hypothetical protein
MNIMRDLKAVNTEREEVRVGGETHDDKKGEEGRKEERRTRRKGRNSTT